MATTPCLCPPKGTGEPRHITDTITLRQTLDFRTSVALRNSVAVLFAEEPDAGVAEILAMLTESYLLMGIESWSLVDDKGKPLPVSHAAIRERLLSNLDVAMVVGDEADELYSEKVMLPLLARASTSSPPTPTNGSTSHPTGPSTTDPKPSKRSSITPIRTGATVTTSSSLVGDSNSSPSSTSAA